MNKPLRRPRVGEPAPDFEAAAIDGSRVRLSGHPTPVAISFMRHLA